MKPEKPIEVLRLAYAKKFGPEVRASGVYCLSRYKKPYCTQFWYDGKCVGESQRFATHAQCLHFLYMFNNSHLN